MARVNASHRRLSKPRRGRRFLPFVLLAVLGGSAAAAVPVEQVGGSAAANAQQSARPSAPFALTGRLIGAPTPRRNARRIAAIRVLRAETGEVAAARRLSRSLTYRAALPAGAYVVAGFLADVPGRTRYSVVSQVVRGKRGARGRLDLRARRARASRSMAMPPAGARAAGTTNARAAGTTRYVGVAPKMVVAGSDIPPGAIDQMLVTDMVNRPCSGRTRLQVLEIEHRQDLIDEIKRSRSPAFDPSTRMTNRLIPPRYMVRGGGAQAGGTLRMQLRMVDLKTGRTVAGASVSGPPGSFFGLYDQLRSKFIKDACRDDVLPYHYKVLDASFQTHASGSQTGDTCGLATPPIPSSGTRDFSGTMTAQPSPPVSKLEQPPGSTSVMGSIQATTAAKWTNDRLNGCKFTSGDPGIAACQINTPDHAPQPGGTWTISYGVDFQPLTQTLTGHWSIPTADIGFVSGGPDPGGCLMTPYILGQLSQDEVAQSQPASIFTATGPQTISFSGSRQFTKSLFGSSTLDYSWTFTITFQRVDDNGNPL